MASLPELAWSDCKLELLTADRHMDSFPDDPGTRRFSFISQQDHLSITVPV